MWKGEGEGEEERVWEGISDKEEEREGKERPEGLGLGYGSGRSKGIGDEGLKALTPTLLIVTLSHNEFLERKVNMSMEEPFS